MTGIRNGECKLQLILPIALALVLVMRIVRSITATAKDLYEIQEENGDIAEMCRGGVRLLPRLRTRRSSRWILTFTGLHEKYEKARYGESG